MAENWEGLLRLELLDHGWTWRYLIDNYMPGLRAASWICVWTSVPPVLPHVVRVTDVLVHEGLTLAAPFRQSERREFRRTILALKTNLLYHAATLLNYSVEVPICKDRAIWFMNSLVFPNHVKGSPTWFGIMPISPDEVSCSCSVFSASHGLVK